MIRAVEEKAELTFEDKLRNKKLSYRRDSTRCGCRNPQLIIIIYYTRR